MTPVPETWIALAHRLAELARPLARRYFRSGVGVESKADDSPVTAADREIEAVMRAEIAYALPDHGILGEEHGAERMDAEAVWVLDPIDGTRAFVTGLPLFGTLIACCVGGRPVLGLIDQPIQGERWVGVAGRRTVYSGYGLHEEPVRVSGKETLSQAYAYTTAPELYEDDPTAAAAFARIHNACAMTRYGSDCYAFGLLASGQIDLAYERGLQAYDYCALVPVVEGAGGTMTDWAGLPLGLHSDGTVVAAATPTLHAAARAQLAGNA
jgi:histidinol phosphatase-like enzyme (inositol monophosphatase family)